MLHLALYFATISPKHGIKRDLIHQNTFKNFTKAVRFSSEQTSARIDYLGASELLVKNKALTMLNFIPDILHHTQTKHKNTCYYLIKESAEHTR